jgi:hypothetical protein
MDDVPNIEDFGSSEALLKRIQERSDDIEKAMIIPPRWYRATTEGKQMSAPLPHFAMILCFINGDRKMIKGADVEMVLNDGILNRMKIRIELAEGR